jgi:hypothetical protein
MRTGQVVLADRSNYTVLADLAEGTDVEQVFCSAAESLQAGITTHV